jgi:CzcA family heavy metal efflux pump
MMRWIVGSSLKFRYLIVVGGLAMMVFGLGMLRDTPVDVFPEFAQPKVEIQTMTFGLSAEETEELVTVPMEQSLQGIPNLETIRSKSVPGLSQIVLLFDRGTDLLHARQVVDERVGTITPQLPTWAAPPIMIQPLSSTSRVMKIGLTSKSLNLMDMSIIAYWKIRARLLRVPGVANTPIWGERLKIQMLHIDPKKLKQHGVELEQVMDDASSSLDSGLLQFSEGSVIGTGGFIDTPNQRLNIRHVAPVVEAKDLANVPIERVNGKRLTLADVGNLVIDHQPLVGEGVINDGPGLMMIVEKLPWANTLEVTRGVEEAMKEMEPGLPGMEIDTTIFRPATFIEESMTNLTEALLIGGLLVVLILGFFLFEWRSAVICLTAIPLSLIAAGLVLHLRGTTINVMVLAGLVIALGVVVDDAIVGIENTVRRLRQHRREPDGRSTSRVILEASLEVRGPIVYATLIIVAAMIPIFFLTGLTGAFFSPLAASYVLAVAVSLVVALTVTPAMSLILLANAPLEKRESPFTRWLQRGYERSLQPIIAKPWRAYAVVGVTVVAGVAVVPFLGQDLLPSFKERDFLMHWLTAPDTSGPEETRVSVRACKELRTIPGVRNCGSHIGQAFMSDEPYGIYFGENWISVDPKVDYDKTLAHVQEVVEGYPGIRRDVQTYLKERIREVLTGSSDALVVRVFGDDLHTLHAQAEKVMTAMEGIDGLIEPKIELHSDIPQVEVQVDLAKAQQVGVKPGDVRRQSGVWLAGEEVGDLFHGGRAYDVNIWAIPAARHSLHDIKAIPIDTAEAGKVRLDSIASVAIKPTPNTIERENLSRRLEVSANVSGRDLGSVAGDLQDRIEDINFPLGYRAELLGEFKERQDAQSRMLLFGIGAAAMIFLLLQASFRSFRLATLSFLTLPMALVGGALAAYIGGGVLSLGSLVGFFTVFGIAARNGILMINHFQHLEEEEGEPFGPKLVLRGARERLAPILMTTLACGLALVPLVVAGSVPGNEIEHPLAVVVVGGLFTSTLLNLFVVPALYLRFARGKKTGAPQASFGLAGAAK